MTVRRNPQEHEAHTGQPKFSLAKNRGVAGRRQPQRGSEGTAWSTRNTWPDIVSQVLIHRIGSPLLYPGGILRPRSSGNFSAFRVYSFGGLPETPVIGRDNMSGLKNWPVFESGHVRYRKPSPPITSGGRIHPFLTHFGPFWDVSTSLPC